MKKIIYIIATEVPSLRGGSSVRNLNLIKQYVAAGYDVSVFCLVGPNDGLDVKKLKLIKSLKVYTVPLPELTLALKIRAVVFNRVLPTMLQFKKSELSNKFEEICSNLLPDYVQIEQISTYYAIESKLHQFRQKSIIILDAHNVEQKALGDSIKMFNPIKKIIAYYILPKYSRLENKFALSVNAVLCCSQTDISFFKNNGVKLVIDVPNGVDCNYFIDQNFIFNKSLLFMGSSSYPPNNDALRWYFSEIHNLVKQEVPDLKLYIIGNKPQDWLVKLATSDASVILPGYVNDVRKYINLSSVCMSPMRGGSGTSLKILEYMASARVVISTTIGARGINYKNGRDIVIADDANKFASGIILSMKSEEINYYLAEHSRILMITQYDWSFIFFNLDNHLKQLTRETYYSTLEKINHV